MSTAAGVWFASAYDTDDVAYRLLTLVQMAGALVLAAGVPAAFDGRYLVVTVGYTIMRVALIAQWARACREHPAGRRNGAIVMTGMATCQVLWLARLLLPDTLATVVFPVLVALEIVVPYVGSRAGGSTPWHPGHIAERFGLFTIIVLGEVLLATTNSIRGAVQDHGLSADLLMVAGGGLLAVFGMWWLYFKRSAEDDLRLADRSEFVWGYGHYFVFAAAAAVGAGLGAMTDVAEHEAHTSARLAGLSLAVAVARYLTVLAFLHSTLGTGAILGRAAAS